MQLGLIKQQWLTLNDEMITIVFEIILIVVDWKIVMIAIDCWSNINGWDNVD